VDNHIEYRLAPRRNSPPTPTEIIQAKDEEIAGLKRQLAEKDAEIARLTELLTAPSLATVQ
jgi:hypothetical protein